MKISLKVSKSILNLYFVLLATVFNLFTIDGKNYLLMGFALIGGIVLIVVNFRSTPKPQNLYPLLVVFYVLIVALFNFSDSQFLSVAYTFFFVLSFIFYSTFIQARLSSQDYQKLLIFVFILYLIGLIVGQWYVYTGRFSPISGVAGLYFGSFGTTLESGGYRFFSLSSEPSYAAFIVVIIYYSIVEMDMLEQRLSVLWHIILFLALFYMILMFKSAYGIILLAFFLLKLIGFNWKSLALLSLIPLILISFFFIDLETLKALDIGSLNRVITLIEKVNFENFDNSLFKADFSAYFRIAPILYYFKTSSLFDIHFYIGHGAAAARNFVVPSIYTAYVEGEYRGGFMPSFLYDYGIIGGLLVVGILAKFIPRLFSFPTLVILLMIFNANINTQLFWFFVLCLGLNKNFKNQSKIQPSNFQK